MSLSAVARMLFFVALFGITGSAHALTLKIATLAPDGTTWMKEMRAAAGEIAEKTEGRVKLKLYPGGVMGNDKAVMKKIRLGQLHGGAITGGSLSSFYPEIGAYSLPMLFRNYAEVDYVRPRLDPELAEGLRERGFVMLGITEGGFAYLMSSDPVRSSEELKAHKLWIPEDDWLTEAMFRKMGVAPVPLSIADVYTGLQTGLIDSFGSTPAGALAFQWHTRVGGLVDVPLMYLVGVVIVDRKRFDRISASDQKIIGEVFRRVFKDMDEKNRMDNEQARSALQNLGVEFVKPADGEVDHWRQLADEVVADSDIPPGAQQVQGRVQHLLEEFRSTQAGK